MAIKIAFFFANVQIEGERNEYSVEDHPMPDARSFLVPAFFHSFTLTHPSVYSLLSHSFSAESTRTRVHTHIHSILFCRLSLTRTQLKCPANYRIVNKLDIFVEAT